MPLKIFYRTFSTQCKYLPELLKFQEGKMPQKNKRPFTIIVEGNIGSGKTTFLKNFENNKHLEILPEPVTEWRNVNGHDLLHLLYTDIRKWAFIFQTYVQVTMMKNHEKKTDKPVKIMERSLFSGRYVFIDNLRQMDILTAPEVAVLDEWFKWLIKKDDFSVDLIVYLKTSPEKTYQRIKDRCRKGEELIPFEYIQKLHESHENWLLHKNKCNCPAPVLVLDGDKNLDDIKEEYHNFQTHLDSLNLSHKYYLYNNT